MTFTKRQFSRTPSTRPLVVCALLIAVSGCSSMDMAKSNLNRYCAKRGEHPFVKEATQNGIPVVLDFGSMLVAVCYSDDEIVHFPDLGIDIIPLGEAKSETGGVGVISVTSHSIADKAGLRVGDIIAQYAGQVTASPAQLRAAVDAATSGQPVTVSYRREKHDLTATFKF